MMADKKIQSSNWV